MSWASAINKHGQTLTYRHFTSVGNYNPATSSVSGATYTDYTIKGYVYAYNTTEIDGTSVVSGDRRIMISSTGIPKPTVDDTFSGIGDMVSVVSVREVIYRGSVLGYILQVRE